MTILIDKNVFGPLGYSASAYVMVGPERYSKIPKRGDLMERFLRYWIGGLKFRGALYMEKLIFGILRYHHLRFGA